MLSGFLAYIEKVGEQTTLMRSWKIINKSLVQGRRGHQVSV